MAKAVGIDLGTTNSVIAAWEGGQADRRSRTRRAPARRRRWSRSPRTAIGWSASWPAARRS